MFSPVVQLDNRVMGKFLSIEQCQQKHHLSTRMINWPDRLTGLKVVVRGVDEMDESIKCTGVTSWGEDVKPSDGIALITSFFAQPAIAGNTKTPSYSTTGLKKNSQGGKKHYKIFSMLYVLLLSWIINKLLRSLNYFLARK